MRSVKNYINEVSKITNESVLEIYAENPIFIFLVALGIMSILLYYISTFIDIKSDTIAYTITGVETDKKPK
jgi:hypothetical protein